MKDLRTLVDDEEVTLAFYGSIVYVAVVAALGAQDEPVHPPAAISAIVGSATVLFTAHAFAALVPRAARAGRLHAADLARTLRHDAPLLISAIVPVVPLLLAAWGVLSLDRGYRLSVRFTMLTLFGLATIVGRRDGLPWSRAIVAAAVIILITVVVIWLETQVH
jgi:hypothetical protein